MKNNILLISTYTQLTNIAKKISKEMVLNLDIYEGGIMKGGHIYARDKQNSYDVIISQGGTAEAIKKLVNVPVVTIEIRTVDFLKALYKASEHKEKIGLFVFESEILKDLQELKRLLAIDFILSSYTTKEELEDRVDKAIKAKVSTLIGTGDCILEMGKKHNINAFLIHSKEKQIEEAFIIAKNICDLSRREKEKAERFKMILDFSGDGIIALDDKDNIITFNPVAEKIFNLQSAKVIDKSIHNSIDSFLINKIYGNGEMLFNKLININGKELLMNRVPIVIEENNYSVVMTFQEVTKLQELERKVRTQLYKKGLLAKYTFDDIKGKSNAIKTCINQAKIIGVTNTTVLINGETGSGKELFAQSIHNISSRKKGPFVAINCAAIPGNLLESELFGYEEGAFTGARKGGKSGLFELAHEGTIFLDEVSEMPLNLQGRLLRVLQEREVLRVGGDYITHVDIRIIAATNADLVKLVKAGRFRQDLYFRLNILDLRIPPLRERKKDIPILVDTFIKKMNIKHGRNIGHVSDDGIKLLKTYDWPGNIRELESFCEKMCVLSTNQIIEENIIYHLFSNNNLYDKEDIEIKSENDINKISVKFGSLKEIEHQVIKKAIEIFDGDRTALAEKLGMSRTTLWKKLKEIE
jgi:PAS domain S-box-containing protein